MRYFRRWFLSLGGLCLTVLLALNLETLFAAIGLSDTLPRFAVPFLQSASSALAQPIFIWIFGFVTGLMFYFIAGPLLRQKFGKGEIDRLVDERLRKNALQFAESSIFKIVPFEQSPSSVYLIVKFRNIASVPISMKITHAMCSLQNKTNDKSIVSSGSTFIGVGQTVSINVPPIPDVDICEQITGRMTITATYGFDDGLFPHEITMDGDIEIALRTDANGTFHQSFAIYPREVV